MQEQIAGALDNLRNYAKHARGVLAYLRKKNDAGKKIEPWKEDQLNRFLEVIGSNVSELERAFNDKNVSKTAWVARNLLELFVWVKYCNLSDAHGKRFRVDGARDLKGFFEAFQKLHFDKIKNDLKRMEEATDELETILKNEFGVPKLDTAYERVSNAAREIGDTRFESLYKLCSKIAHPTAWVVASVHFDNFEHFNEMFLLEGNALAYDALEAVQEFILKHYPAPAMSGQP